MQRRRLLVLAIGVVAVILLAACDPVPHPVHTEVAPASSGLKVVAVAGDGRYVVVESAGTDTVTPGAGRWRIDRSDGTALAAPGAEISRDGHRIAVGRSLWVDGTTLPGPADIPPGIPSLQFRWSPDLRFAIYYDFQGTFKRWDPQTATGTPIDLGPAPSGATGGSATGGISDDGTVVLVSYSDGVCNSLRRVVDLEAGITTDLVARCGELDSLSSDGSTLLRVGPATLSRTEVTLIETSDGSMGQTYSTPPGFEIDRWTSAVNGNTVWVSEARKQQVECGPTGPCTVKVERHVVAVRRGSHRAFPADPGELTTFSTDTSGRFLAYSTWEGVNSETDGWSPARVLDWVTANVETLTVPGSPDVSSRPFVAAGGNLVITGTARQVDEVSAGGYGWQELTSSPPG